MIIPALIAAEVSFVWNPRSVNTDLALCRPAAVIFWQHKDAPYVDYVNYAFVVDQMCRGNQTLLCAFHQKDPLHFSRDATRNLCHLTTVVTAERDRHLECHGVLDLLFSLYSVRLKRITGDDRPMPFESVLDVPGKMSLQR